MPTYENGYIPLSLLTIFERGHNTNDGDWYHALSPASYARHKNLVYLAHKRTGRTLKLTDGFSAYRPYAAQVRAKQLYGNGAATPGTSSHGGLWEDKQTLAMDYGNWSAVYTGFGGLDSFAADCRKAGLSPLLITPARGYPYEPWHVVDLNPWSAVPASVDVQPFPNTTSKEDKVIAYHFQDTTARSKTPRTVAAGGSFYLNTAVGKPTSSATNVAGGVGEYSFTAHVYAQGAPGDVLTITYWWDDTKTTGPNSGHYQERLVVDRDGYIRASREFKRAVSAGYAVYLQAVAASANKAPLKVTALDSDAYLFVAA